MRPLATRNSSIQAAIDRYRDGPGAYTAGDPGQSALQRYAAIEEILMTAADELSREGPAGGLHAGQCRDPLRAADGTRCSSSSPSAAACRVGLFKQRFDRAVAEGELPPGTDTCALARFFGTVLQGMTIQARDEGRRRRGPQSCGARRHLRAWPAAVNRRNPVKSNS